jgi:hypothetical protein
VLSHLQGGREMDKLSARQFHLKLSSDLGKVFNSEITIEEFRKTEDELLRRLEKGQKAITIVEQIRQNLPIPVTKQWKHMDKKTGYSIFEQTVISLFKDYDKVMTNEDNKLIFNYCGWKPDRFLCTDEGGNLFYRDLEGNDMVEAKEKLNTFNDWENFYLFAEKEFRKTYYVASDSCFFVIRFIFVDWFTNIQNFFSLMVEWLKERVK